MPERPNAFEPTYRPDIDGLRAIAVMIVVGCHARFRFFEGGYVGVDVFFVISGFLIGSMLLREVRDKGRIDYVRFYERRIRRIIPALLSMLLAVSAVAYFVFLPKDLIELARMGAATLLFSSNIYLSGSGGYFGSDAAYNLLTHTWSLGVEEQFYILLPPLLMLFRRTVANGKIGAVIACIAGLSFAVSIPLAYLAPTSAFYLLPTRIWELLLGTLASIYGPHIGRLSAPMRSVLAWTGLAAIVLPTLLYSSDTVFPGLAALPPCAGAVLLIATGSTLVHRMLAWRVCVLIGQISYSLYLWHWPILVYNFLYPFSTGPHPWAAKLALVAISLIFAYVSWRWIETPFRHGRLKPSRAALFAMTGALAGALLGFFFLIVATGGAAYRFSPAERQIAQYRQNGGIMEKFRTGKCFIENPTDTRLPDRAECLTLDPIRPNYLLLGSSYVAQFNAALRENYPEIHFLQATSPNCTVRPPSARSTGKGCSALMHFIFADFLVHHRVDAVIIQIEPGDPPLSALGSALAFFARNGIRAYVIGPQLKYDRLGPALAIDCLRDAEACGVKDHLMDISASGDQAYRALVEREDGIYLSMFETLCPSGSCRILAQPGIPMEADRIHLTYAGTQFVVESWRAQSLLRFR